MYILGLIGLFFMLRSSRTVEYSCSLASFWSVISRWPPGRYNYKAKVKKYFKQRSCHKKAYYDHYLVVLNWTVNDSG